MKVVVAIDSFKGCMTSLEAGRAAAEGVLQACPDAETDIIETADGGEGTMSALAAAFAAVPVKCRVTDPLGRPFTAAYFISPCGTALVEVAAASGLGLLKDDERNPAKTSSYGTGMLIAHALKAGAKRLIIGLGGSATVDGGTGLLAALGAVFGDGDGRVFVPCGGADMGRIASVTLPAFPRGVNLTIAADVDNPLCGPQGAARVFGPQKGASPSDVERLEAGMTRWAALLGAAASLPGAGAAGGIGAALAAWSGAQIVRGIETVLDAVGFDRRIVGADLVITGEGRLDSQTLMGKAPAGVLRRCVAAGVPCAVLGGSVDPEAHLADSGFSAVAAIAPESTSLAERMNPAVAARNLRLAARELTRRSISRNGGC